jgi:hypothetical protein
MPTVEQKIGINITNVVVFTLFIAAFLTACSVYIYRRKMGYIPEPFIGQDPYPEDAPVRRTPNVVMAESINEQLPQAMASYECLSQEDRTKDVVIVESIEHETMHEPASSAAGEHSVALVIPHPVEQPASSSVGDRYNVQPSSASGEDRSSATSLNSTFDQRT